ncbi:MAG TPA: SURF1 family protein [Longimicrobium sp.]|jgi:surfeit locus 1 family protein|nr:SURF1 family protein [Longimicrobium sp.]
MKLSLRGILATVFVLGMCAVCVRLGFWQLERLQQRRTRNHVQAQALRMPTLDYDSMTAEAIEREPSRFLNRKMRVAGTYDASGEIVLRGRADDGRPGVHLVTPIVVPGVPRALLVNRGWVPSPDAATVDARPYAEAGTRTVDGILMEIPRGTRNGGEPAVQRAPGGPPTPSYRRLDLDVLRRVERRPIVRLYLQQLPGADSASGRPPVRVPLQPMDNGPHLSYAFQWFSFAAIGVIGLLVVFLRRRRQGASAS